MKRLRLIKILKSLFLFIMFSVCFLACKKTIEKEVAEVRTKEYRSLTIINKIEETLISECILTTAQGVLVARQEKLTEKNIVFANFDSKSAFKNEKDFKITLIDRYGLKYEKTFKAKEEGNTDVVIDDKSYVSQDGDWFKKVKRFFNK